MKGERNETLSLEKYGELSRGEKNSMLVVTNFQCVINKNVDI
jgi:hypothetical protein